LAIKHGLSLVTSVEVGHTGQGKYDRLDAYAHVMAEAI